MKQPSPSTLLRRTDRPQAWIVVTRPNNLPTALAVAVAVADRFPGGCRLLWEDSSWWRNVRWDEHRARFAAVHRFERVKACRGPLDAPRMYRQLAVRQRELAALPFLPGRDVLLCLAGVFELANAACAAFRAGQRVLCIPRLMHDSLVRPPDRWRYRFTTAGWLQNRLIEPLVGLERTLHFKPRLNRGGDGVRHVRLHRSPERVYDAVVVMSNTGEERPAGTGARTLPARFPDLSELSVTAGGPSGAAEDARRRVVFFGTPFLLVENLSPAVYIDALNRCLAALRRWYPDRTWIYRPHPAETGEVEALRLEGFQVERDGEVAELYFLKHFRRIEAVYSVSSTVSRVALNSGLNAHSFWRCFPFAETQRQFFGKVMGTVPAGFEVSDLSRPPLRGAENARRDRSAGGTSLGEALRTALDLTPGPEVVSTNSSTAGRWKLPVWTGLHRGARHG